MEKEGGILVVASTVTHLIGRRPGSPVASLGVALGVAGLAVGLVTLLVFAFTRTGSRRRPAGHRHRGAAYQGSGRARGRALNPTNVYSQGGLIDVPRDARTPASARGAPRSPGFDTAQETVRAPGPQGARETFRPPVAAAASRGTPNAPPATGRPGTAPPWPGHQAGAPPAPAPAPGMGAGTGWRPPGRPSQPPMSS